MFGVRLTSLFTSRWMALAWAVLICLSAIQFVGTDGDQDAPASQASTDADAAAVNVAIAALH
jgi:hypothetical protein